MPHEPPLPVSAVKRPGVPEIDVTFDKPLRDGLSAIGNWTGRHANFLWVANAPPVVAGSVVNIHFIPTVPTVFPDVVNYAATPPDIVRFPSLVPAAPFANFPVT